jgi:transcriptional regulator with XRE-family HTH domain
MTKMYGNVQKRYESDVQELRRAGGQWLRELREQQGLSQRQMAKLVDAEYYTFISQLETGRGRVPPDRYRTWAAALGVDPAVFVRNLLRFYDPVTFEILFGGEHSAQACEPALADERPSLTLVHG